MPANPILVVAPSPELGAQLEAQLGAAGYAVTTVPTAADADAALRDGSFDALVAEGLAVSGAIAGLRVAAGKPLPVVVIAPAGDVEQRIAFLEAGADEVIAAGFARRELDSRIQALLIRSGRLQTDASGSPPAGQITTFFSPKGGVGTTTLAVNTAVLMAGGGGSVGGGLRVLLIDLDLQFGQVATQLNLSPRFDIGGLCSDDGALGDLEQALTYLTPHASGVSVLAAPSNPDADFRIGLEQLERAISVLRPRFDQVIIDAGSHVDERTLWVLEQSETHVLVIFPEIAALRASSMLLAYLGETERMRARTLLVINHPFPRELLKTRDIEGLLRTKPAAEIPFSEVEVARGVNEGAPVVSARPRSPVSIAIGRLAQTILGVEANVPPATASRSRRGGLLRGRG